MTDKLSKYVCQYATCWKMTPRHLNQLTDLLRAELGPLDTRPNSAYTSQLTPPTYSYSSSPPSGMCNVRGGFDHKLVTDGSNRCKYYLELEDVRRYQQNRISCPILNIRNRYIYTVYHSSKISPGLFTFCKHILYEVIYWKANNWNTLINN